MTGSLARVHTRPVRGLGPLVDYFPPGGVAWLQGDSEVIAWGEAARIDLGIGPHRYSRATSAMADLFGPSLRGREAGIAFVWFTFDDGEAGSGLLVPEITLQRVDLGTSMTVVGDATPGPLSPQPGPVREDRVRYAGATLPDTDWVAVVAAAIERLSEGTLEKVVLARDRLAWSREPFHMPTLLRRLARGYPDCFAFAVDGFIGASPELLLRRTGTAVEALALAGSAPRGDSDDADQELATDLLNSSKDRLEHTLAVQSVLAGLEAGGASVTRADEPTIFQLDNIQHLATRVIAEVEGDVDSFDLLASLHPTAAVGGTPAHEALAFISENEGMARGRYGGPIGWIAPNSDCEFAIALRCAEIDGSRARLFAGAGIVKGSLPEAELEETRLKLRAMESALEGKL